MRKVKAWAKTISKFYLKFYFQKAVFRPPFLPLLRAADTADIARRIGSENLLLCKGEKAGWMDACMFAFYHHYCTIMNNRVCKSDCRFLFYAFGEEIDMAAKGKEARPIGKVGIVFSEGQDCSLESQNLAYYLAGLLSSSGYAKIFMVGQTADGSPGDISHKRIVYLPPKKKKPVEVPVSGGEQGRRQPSSQRIIPSHVP